MLDNMLGQVGVDRFCFQFLVAGVEHRSSCAVRRASTPFPGLLPSSLSRPAAPASAGAAESRWRRPRGNPGGCRNPPQPAAGAPRGAP